MAYRPRVMPDPPLDGRRPPTQAEAVIAIARGLVDAQGMISTGALVHEMVRRGQDVRAAWGTLDLLARRVLAIVTEPTPGRAHADLEPVIETDSGRRTRWISTRILPPRPKRERAPRKHTATGKNRASHGRIRARREAA